MQKRKLNGGNAMVLVLIIGMAVGTMAFAGISLTGAVSNSASKAINDTESRWIMTGAAELAKSDLIAKRISPGVTKLYTIAGASITVSTADNSLSLANTVKLTLTGTYKGRALSSTQVIALAKSTVTTIWSHGIYSNTGFTWPAASMVTGSVYFRNNISVNATGGKITQDFKTSSMFNPMGLITVGGAILTGMTPFQWPAANGATYTGKADSVLTGNQTLSAYTFPVQNALVVVNGNLTLTNALITRSGTFYVTGNVTVDKMIRANPSDHIAVICPNGITFSNGNKAIAAEGYFFAGGTITVSSPLALTGAMVGNGFVGTSPLNVTWDQWIMADPANGQALKAPGLWP